MVMQARIKDTELSTGHFYFNKNHSTLMKLDNEVSGSGRSTSIVSLL